jgi:hypothetical protein
MRNGSPTIGRHPNGAAEVAGRAPEGRRYGDVAAHTLAGSGVHVVVLERWPAPSVPFAFTLCRTANRCNGWVMNERRGGAPPRREGVAMPRGAETVIVTFDEVRDVYVDGLHLGVTNRRFVVSTGVHTFWLDGDGYGPSSITETIKHTTPDDPFVVNFVLSSRVRDLLVAEGRRDA